MDDAALARLENDNMAEWLRVSCGQVPGSLVHEEGGVIAFGSGLPIPLFNQVVVTADDATDNGMEAAIRAMQDRRAPFYLVLRRGIDDRFDPLARNLGLVQEDDVVPGMARQPIARDSTRPPDGLDIRRIDDAAGLEDHLRVLIEGFEIPESISRPWLGDRLWAVPDCAMYVGYADGRPGVSGFSVRTGKTLGVYNIATLPGARRRGYGAAMTARLAADGAAAGCDVAVLQASEMGRPVYERLGFRTVIERDVYLG